MRIQWIRWMVVLFALVLLGGTAVTGKAQAKEKEVIFLSIADYTGPIAGLNVPADMGVEDYFKYLNDKGGVDGVKVKFVGVDTRYDLARGLSAYKRYRRNPKLMVVNSISTPLGKAIAPMTRRDKLVTLTPADGEFQANIGNVFPWGPCYQDAFAASIDWMVADWKKKGKSGKPTIGLLTWDSPYGREVLRGGKEHIEKLGLKFLPPEFFPPGSLKHDVYLTRLARAGANYVYVGGVDPTQTNVMRDAFALGLTKKIQFVSDYWGPSALGVSLHPKALEGMAIVSFFLRGDEARKNPLVSKLWNKYRKQPIEKMNEAYAFGAAWGITFEAALKDALKRVGYKKLTRAEIYESYQRITGISRLGLQGPCAYSKTSRRGSWEVKFYQVKGGKIIPITDWIKAPDAVSLHKW